MTLGPGLQPDNSPDQLKMRRSQNTLIIVGSGIILFGVWTVFKTLGMLIIRKPLMTDQIEKALSEQAEPVSDGMVFIILVITAVIFLLVDIAVRLIIGRSAIAEGRDKRHGIIYIPLTIIMILLSVLQLIREGYLFINPEDIYDEASRPSLAGVIIELTSMIMMIQMLVSAAWIRKYRKKLKKEKKS